MLNFPHLISLNMNKKAICAIILLFISVAIYAQTNTVKRTYNVRRVINENTVVVDSAGKRYDYDTWHKMTETGNYRLTLLNPIVNGVPNNDPNAAYTIVPFTAEQKLAMKARMGKPHESLYFTTGEKIDPFRVRTIQGQKINAEDWAGKVVVLNFWFIGCSPCRQEMPELNKIVAKYADNPNVIFIGVALDQSWDVKDFIKTTAFNYQLVGNGRQYADLFSIRSYPTNVVVDKEGKVRFHAMGYSLNTPDWIEKTIDECIKQ